ncbi:MAG: hypothetical protein ABWY03_03870 [Microbacterium sp.]
MSSIDMRFASDSIVSGDPLDGWTAASRAHPSARVHGIDLLHASRPRAVRALVHQRMTLLQLALLRDREVRRALVVARLDDSCDLDRACAGFAAAAASIHRRFELQRGRPLGITVLVAPRSAPTRDVQLRVAEGAPIVPDGPAAVTWTQAREWGIRAAVNLQTL